MDPVLMSLNIATMVILVVLVVLMQSGTSGGERQ